MKYSNALIVLTLFSLCSMLKAQEQPLAFDRNMLAHSQGLPNDFLLFSPDTCVQILFNPARAAMSERRFVYASYLPDPNSSQTIFSNGSLTGAALFNAIGSTWLLQASNSLNRNSIDYSLSGQDYEEQINTSDLYNSLSNNSFLFNGSFTAIKLSLVGTAGENSYSVGAFGIFMPQTETLNSTHHSSDDYHYYDPINSYGYEYHEVFRSDEQLERANSKYAIGLEFSLAGLGWDFITCLSFQKDKVNRISTVLSNDDYYRIYANSDVNTQTTIHSSTDKRTIEPGIYDIHGYFQHTADWITPH